VAATSQVAAALDIPNGIHFAENGPGLSGPIGVVRAWRGKLGLRHAKYVVGWSSNAASVACEKWAFPGIVRAFPGVGVPDIFFDARPIDRGKRPRTLLFVGRLVPAKGVSDVLAVFQRLVHLNVRLVVVGDGALRGEVMRAERSGLRVEYLGRLSRERVAQIMANAAVTLVPSHAEKARGFLGSSVRVEEQFGLVIAESLAAGTPVVAYRSGSIAETVGPGGILCDVGDVQALTNATRQLLVDEGLWRDTAEQGRDWAENFRDSEIASQLTQLWTELAK
jgi:glycosyltransferase involved in cell wall biosynthesis